jgi:hypothetical protein
MRIRFTFLALLALAAVSLVPWPTNAQTIIPTGQVSTRRSARIVTVTRPQPTPIPNAPKAHPEAAPQPSSQSPNPDVNPDCQTSPTSLPYTLAGRAADIRTARGNAANARFPPSRRAYNKLVEIESATPSPSACSVWAASRLADQIAALSDQNTRTTYHLILNEANSIESNLGDQNDWAAVDQIVAAAGNLNCYATHTAPPADSTSTSSANSANQNSSDDSKSSSTTGTQKVQVSQTYFFPGLHNSGFFPTWGRGCSQDADTAFFGLSNWVDPATTEQYLYNIQDSESQVSSDLFSFAVPGAGFEVVLGSTITSGGSTSTTSSSGSSTGSLRGRFFAARASSTNSSGDTTTTDSAETALSKLEQGGDFNLRIPIPLFNHPWTSATLEGILSPNVGITVNGFGTQQTITQATQAAWNLPIEIYYQNPVGKSSGSSSSGNAAGSSVFVDVKPSAEFLGTAIAQQLGPSVPTKLFLLQASAGFEFAGQFRLSAQYFWGNQSIFKSINSTTSTTTTSLPTTGINGVHLVLSYTPQKSKNQSSSN